MGNKKGLMMQRYTGAAMAIHWLMALIIIGLLAVGLWMVELPLAPLKFEVYQWHKSFGLFVLILLIVRVGWRWTNPVPMMGENMPKWQVRVAEMTHFLLYFLMVAMPISGWVMSDAAGYSPRFFGLWVPQIWVQDQTVVFWAKEVHEIMGKMLIGLIVVHGGAAVFHHLIQRDDILLRMVPVWVRLPRPKLWAGIVVLLAALPWSGQATEWRVVPEESKLEWVVAYNGQEIVGQFKNWQADIVLDTANLATAKVKVVVDLASVASGDGNRDETLRGGEFFNVAAHPQAVFESSKVRREGPGFVAEGTLQLAGVSQPLVLPFTLKIEGDGAVRVALASGQVGLSRAAFGVGKGAWQGNSTIADAVQVRLVVKAVVK